MIQGFKKETAPLTEDELKLVPLVIKQLSKCVGEKNAKRNKDICFLLNNNSKNNVRSVTMRKLINHIRRNNKLPLLVATSKGYYISNDIPEIELYLLSLTQRCSAINAMARAVKKQCDQLKKEQGWIAESRKIVYEKKSTAAITQGHRYRLLRTVGNKYVILNDAGKVASFSKKSFRIITPRKKAIKKALK